MSKEIWDKVKSPPASAMKKITGGRLNNMTDIKPQWRLEVITELFGPAGVGWNYQIEKQWTEEVKGEVCAFTNVLFKFKHDGEWSEWIPGTGGSKLAAQEKAGIYVSDECFKMSLTDALSVAMKAIGVGAEVYLGNLSHDSKHSAQNSKPSVKFITNEQLKTISDGLSRLPKEITKRIYRAYKIEDLAQLPAEKYQEAFKGINAYLDKQAEKEEAK